MGMKVISTLRGPNDRNVKIAAINAVGNVAAVMALSTITPGIQANPVQLGMAMVPSAIAGSVVTMMSLAINDSLGNGLRI